MRPRGAPGFGLWRLYALLAALLGGALLLAFAGRPLWAALVALAVLSAGTLLALADRRRPEQPLPPAPVPPLLEPGVVEGRVVRMSIEETEVPTNLGTPWEGKQVATVYVIVISGLRYTVDPGPARRGRFDWLREGMWVRATYDRRTRVIYAMVWIPAPTG